MERVFEHIMLDIETMGTSVESAIISIAAVEFNIETGEVGDKFYKNITLRSCMESGLKVDANTIMWWMKQSDEARKKLDEDTQIHLFSALSTLAIFLDQNYYVWGNSARFDLGILENAYLKTNREIPWNFRLERDVRTLVGLHPYYRDNEPFTGVKHNAIDDCLHQIKYCSKTWRYLKGLQVNI